MHPPMPPPPPRRVSEPPRPSRVSFQRKLDDFTATAAAAPARLPLLRLERRSGLPRVDPRVPDDEQAGAFADAEADPSERSTANPFFDRTDYGEKTLALDNDAGPGPWVLGRTGLLLLFDPRLFGDDTKKTGVDAEAELRTGSRRFFDHTGSDEETRTVNGDAEAGPSVPGRSGRHLLDDTDSHNKKTTGAVDDAAVQGLERRSPSDGRLSTVGDEVNNA